MEGTVRRQPQAWISRLSTRQAASEGSRGDEAGSSLVLALVFLVAVSLIVMGLLGWLGTSLNASAVFSNQRNVDNAATNAVNLAIQNTRYSFDQPPPDSLLDASSPQSCLSPAYPVDNGSGSVAVYCTMVWQPNGANAYTVNQDGYSRVITYSACLSGVARPRLACAAQPLLQAVVGFDDYPAGTVAPSIDPTECAPIANNGNCGETMTQLSWQWNPVVPAVSSISPSSGPITGGTTIQINGSGFVSGETVNFLEESGGAPASGYNPPVSATIVSNPPASCPLSTCLEAVTPTVVSGSTYFVTVTTPGGTSPYSPASPYVPVFTYQAGTPVVTGLTGAVTGGPVTGGSTVTIQGTGFWGSSTIPAQVFFCPTTGASCSASPSNTSDGVTVSPPSGSTPAEITAQSPAVGPSGVGTYDVQVEVNNVYSALTSTAQFTYALFVPVVTSVTPETRSRPAAPSPSMGTTSSRASILATANRRPPPLTTARPAYNPGGNAAGSPTLQCRLRTS